MDFRRAQTGGGGGLYIVFGCFWGTLVHPPGRNWLAEAIRSLSSPHSGH